MIAQKPWRFARTFEATQFQKGNLHTHTTLSDGTDRPEDVIAWYRAHDYRFLAITDHSLRSEPSAYAAWQDDSFRLIAGEEISMTGAGRQVHVNALCTRRTIGGGTFSSASDALNWALSEVETQDGVALVNHPNFDRGLTGADLLTAPGANLLEIWSGHPYVFSQGIDGRPSHEDLWDFVLTRGMIVMGVAVDDTHRVLASGDPPAFPGVGWIEVFASANDEEELCEALRRGLLLASTGAELSRIRVSDDVYAVWPRDAARVSFFARGGTLIRDVYVAAGSFAAYAIRGGEGYVRARVESASGKAWTPAATVTK